jgi:hypothetical protein
MKVLIGIRGISDHDIIAPPLMGGDRGEGEVSGDPDHHPHLTSPIKREEPIASYGKLQVDPV